MSASRPSDDRSKVRSRTQTGGFRIGLMVVTVVVLTAACGSIEVVSMDGGPGSGGTPGGGSGGMRAGGSGGAAGGQGSGGMGGSNHGSGGMIGGGSGGMNGTGGMTGSGSGGAGSGGMTGSGGSGAGGAGGSGPSCAQIQKAFQIALANAKSCVVGGTGYCGVVTSDKLDCGCPTHVNDTKAIDPIRTQWAQGSCSSGVCTNIACVAYKSATCTVPSGGTAPVCTDSLSLPTP